MDIKITTESRGQIENIQKAFKNQLSEAEILKGTAQAINGVLNRSKSKINKSVKSNYNISQKYLKRISDIYPKAYSSRLYGGIRILYSPLQIVAFKPKQTTTGITVTIRKGKPIVIKNAFIATMTSGHTGVFSRGRYEKKKGFKPENKKTSSGKIRITELNTASPFTMGTSKSVAEDVKTFMNSEITVRVKGILQSKVDRIKNLSK